MKPQLERLSATLSDRYDVQRRVGAGGMATVYLAQDLRHHRKVAVKVLNPEIAEAVGRERFLREIEIAAGLHHPHVLPLFDSGEAAGLLFFVMPFVEGESLRERLDREKQLPVEEAIRIANEVADALDHAHRQDVIHRDIKPGNILLQEGRALVADFGIALAVDDAGSTRLTRTGVSPGTPEYMSPEQASGDWRIDARSDLYSLGCVVYEMLAGEPPHTGPTRQSVLARKLAERPRPVAELRESVPAHVDAALARVLERLPADRFSTAKEFRAALESSSGFVMTPERRRFAPDHTGRAWKLRFMMASAVAVVAGIAAATAWLGPFRAPAAEASVVRRWSILLPDTAPLAFIGSASL